MGTGNQTQALCNGSMNSELLSWVHPTKTKHIIVMENECRKNNEWSIKVKRWGQGRQVEENVLATGTASTAVTLT